MKNIDTFIQERLVINSKSKANQYTCQPKSWLELRNILKERLKKDKDANLNDIDVSQIKDMHNLFLTLDPYNIDISKWDVSNVEDMGSMFDGCGHFNADLSKWNVSNVKYMSFMFEWCENFNCDLSDWNVSNVKDMRWMFDFCKSLKKLPSWYNE